MKKELLIAKRKKAKELFKKGWDKKTIANHLVSSPRSITKWVNLSDKQPTEDRRGWKKGKKRKHTKKEEEEIIAIKKQLQKEESFFSGADVVQFNYEHKYKTKMSKWFVKQVLKNSNLTKRRLPKRDNRSRYMQYPIHILEKLDKRVASIDFIGPKFYANKQVANFLSYKNIRPDKKGSVHKIKGQTTGETLKILAKIWEKKPLPDVLKIDNDTSFGHVVFHKKRIGQFTIALLNLGIYPLYIAPRSPWNNGNVEGFNSVFSRSFWNKLKFKDEKELDIKIQKFNVEYEKYSELINNNPNNIKERFFDKSINLKNREVRKFKVHKIYFLRVVRRVNKKDSKQEKGFINILETKILLDKKYINLYTFSTIDLKKKNLTIEVEDKDTGKRFTIKKIKFSVKL